MSHRQRKEWWNWCRKWLWRICLQPLRPFAGSFCFWVMSSAGSGKTWCRADRWKSFLWATIKSHKVKNTADIYYSHRNMTAPYIQLSAYLRPFHLKPPTHKKDKKLFGCFFSSKMSTSEELQRVVKVATMQYLIRKDQRTSLNCEAHVSLVMSISMIISQTMSGQHFFSQRAILTLIIIMS